jgi:hypothetical protein
MLQYAKFVKPAFDDFVLPSKKYADVIIPRGGDNHVAIDLIVQHIRTKLGQHDLRKIYPNVYVIQSTFQVLDVLWCPKQYRCNVPYLTSCKFLVLSLERESIVFSKKIYGGLYQWLKWDS